MLHITPFSLNNITPFLTGSWGQLRFQFCRCVQHSNSHTQPTWSQKSTYLQILMIRGLIGNLGSETTRMADLDKKKAKTNLVQAVLEAQEKRNQERVDMIVTNAIKQLKMSRFKPDQATCISLTYLARVSPKVFNQSSAIKEVLKSSLRREIGPANIKGNDIILPVLSANILLACCDSTEIRLIILNKVEQWLASNQKVADIVQDILSTICMKCQGDEKTIAMLIDMRQHWLQHLEGSVPPDLCLAIRRLLHTETSCGSLLTYLKFLIEHDSDVDGLRRELAEFKNLPNILRQKLIHSSDGFLIELGLQDADVSQLVELVQQFGMPLSTINKIFDRLSRVKNDDLIKIHIKDQSLFRLLMELYDEMGAPGARRLNESLALSSNLPSITKTEPKIELKPWIQQPQMCNVKLERSP